MQKKMEHSHVETIKRSAIEGEEFYRPLKLMAYV